MSQSTSQKNTRYVFALDTILKHAFEILKTSDDNREKLQTMGLFKDTHIVKLELLSNATTIDSALNYIRNKQREKEQQNKALALDATTSNDNLDDDQLPKAGRQTATIALEMRKRY